MKLVYGIHRRDAKLLEYHHVFDLFGLVHERGDLLGNGQEVSALWRERDVFDPFLAEKEWDFQLLLQMLDSGAGSSLADKEIVGCMCDIGMLDYG